jgi:hypothetical protein
MGSGEPNLRLRIKRLGSEQSLKRESCDIPQASPHRTEGGREIRQFRYSGCLAGELTIWLKPWQRWSWRGRGLSVSSHSTPRHRTRSGPLQRFAFLRHHRAIREREEGAGRRGKGTSVAIELLSEVSSIILDMNSEAEEDAISSRGEELGEGGAIGWEICGGVQSLLPFRQSRGARDAVVESIDSASLRQNEAKQRAH